MRSWSECVHCHTGRRWELGCKLWIWNQTPIGWFIHHSNEKNLPPEAASELLVGHDVSSKRVVTGCLRFMEFLLPEAHVATVCHARCKPTNISFQQFAYLKYRNITLQYKFVFKFWLREALSDIRPMLSPLLSTPSLLGTKSPVFVHLGYPVRNRTNDWWSSG